MNIGSSFLQDVEQTYHCVQTPALLRDTSAAAGWSHIKPQCKGFRILEGTNIYIYIYIWNIVISVSAGVIFSPLHFPL